MNKNERVLKLIYHNFFLLNRTIIMVVTLIGGKVWLVSTVYSLCVFFFFSSPKPTSLSGDQTSGELRARDQKIEKALLKQQRIRKFYEVWRGSVEQYRVINCWNWDWQHILQEARAWWTFNEGFFYHFPRENQDRLDLRTRENFFSPLLIRHMPRFQIREPKPGKEKIH